MNHLTTPCQWVYPFGDLRDLLAKASPARSGEALAGLAAGSKVKRKTSLPRFE